MRATMRLAVAMLAFTASVSGAQGAPAPQAEALRTRIGDLIAAADMARAREKAALARLDSLQGDTVSLDSATIIGFGGDGRRLAAGARMAGERIRRIAGPGSVISFSDTVKLFFGERTGRTPSSAEPMFSDSDEADIAHVITTRLRSWTSRHASAQLRKYAAFPLDADSATLFRRAHTELVSAAPGASTRCALDSAADCALALGLVSSVEPATAMWDSVGRYEMVKRMSNPPRELRQARTMCLEGSDMHCISLIRQVIESTPDQVMSHWNPLGRAAREALLVTAVRQGGPEALQRLHARDSMPLPMLIEHTSGQPLDVVIGSWRSAVMAARPEVSREQAARLGGALWSMVFALVALGGALWRGG